MTSMFHYVKELGKDTIIYGASIIIGRFLTFLLTPLYTHYLSPAELGGIAFLYSLLAFTNIILSAGMESAFFRFAANQPLFRQRQVFSHGWLVSVTASALLIITVFLLTPQLDDLLQLPLPQSSLVIQLSAWITAFDSLLILPFAYWRLHRHTIRFALAKTAIIIVNVGLNVWFLVGLSKTAEWIVIANVLSSGLGLLIVLPLIFRLLDFRISSAVLHQLFRFALPTIPAALGAIILHIGDRPLLKIFTDDAAIGIYQANYRLALPLLLLTTMFEYAWKPFFLKHYEQPYAPRLFGHLSLLFTTVASWVFLLLLLFIDWIVRIPITSSATLIDPRYWSGTSIVPLVAAGYLIYGFTAFFLPGIYLHKRTSLLAIGTSIAALTNVGINILLIPIMGYTAAAWATVLAYSAQFIYLHFQTRQLYPIPFPWTKIILQWLFLIVLWLFIVLFPNYLSIGGRTTGLVSFTVFSTILLYHQFRRYRSDFTLFGSINR